MKTQGYLVHAIGMQRNSSLRIEDGAGLYVHAGEGRLWITQEGEGRDHLIAAGEGFRLDRDGVTIVEAARYTLAALTAPAPAHYARRITLAPGGAGARQVLYDAATARGSWLAGLRYRFRFLEKRRLNPGAL
ncbi:MAG TPA: DUF2917 domain-containing protein [Burkholderiales bacterium]